MSEHVTYSTDYWSLHLPAGWRHEGGAEEGAFTVESEDGTKKIYVRLIFSGRGEPFDVPATIERFEQIVTEMGQKALKSTHQRFLDETGSNPPYSTRLIGAYDQEAHFGLGAMIFVTTDHQLWISVHDYWSDDRQSFESFFRDTLRSFHPVATQEA